MNGLTLCWACHRWGAHGETERFRDFVIAMIGEENFYRLKQLAYGAKKLDRTPYEIEAELTDKIQILNVCDLAEEVL